MKIDHMLMTCSRMFDLSVRDFCYNTNKLYIEFRNYHNHIPSCSLCDNVLNSDVNSNVNSNS